MDPKPPTSAPELVDPRIRNLAAATALLASLAAGIGIQGLVKGGSARELGFVVLLLALCLGVKCVTVANNLSGPDSAPVTRRPAYLRYTVGDRDRLGPLVAVVVVALIVTSAFAVRLNSRPALNFRSAYDGVDPFHAQCALDSKGDGKVIATRPIRAGSQLLGTLELEYSTFCGSHWPRLSLTSAGLAALRGASVVLTARRRSDDTIATYALVVEKIPYMWGNMVGGGVCADAELNVAIRARHMRISAQTPCRNT